jgi:hypothetical protein
MKRPKLAKLEFRILEILWTLGAASPDSFRGNRRKSGGFNVLRVRADAVPPSGMSSIPAA